MKDTMWACCICGMEYEGIGNNPDPVPHKDGERCCDACNSTYVIPIRIMKALDNRAFKQTV